MKGRVWLVLLIVALLACAVLVWRSPWFKRRPMAEWRALDVSAALVEAVAGGTGTGVTSLVVLPAGLADHSVQEKSDFILRALRDEVSVEGLAVMRREATFGSLAKVFPEDAQIWSSSSGVRADDCVAFRLEKNGIRAEIALVTNPTYRVIRVNNVRQMALSPP